MRDEDVWMSINVSAYRHGLEDDDELRRLWSAWVEQRWMDADLPRRMLRICLDEEGRPWEVIGLLFDQAGRGQIIHAQPMRKSTAAWFRRMQ